MNRARTTLSKAFLLVLPLGLGAVIGGAGEAEAQVAPPFPSPAYIATVEPEYFEGHPVYWYNGYWYYRDLLRGWIFYHGEPLYLRDRRASWSNRHRYHYYR
jgi:hypothetical protein